jgi:cytochrome b561
MAEPRQTAGYTGAAKTLHWATVALLAAQFIVAWSMPEIRRNTQPETMINLHLSLGALMLIVVVLRLAWRLTHAEPLPAAGLPPWMERSSRAVHRLLYGLLIVVPILGWMNASFRGFPVTLFGLVDLPSLLAKRTPGFGWTGDVHGLLANYAMLALIGLHVAAALYHYFIRRDGVLQRMLPGG